MADVRPCDDCAGTGQSREYVHTACLRCKGSGTEPRKAPAAKWVGWVRYRNKRGNRRWEKATEPIKSESKALEAARLQAGMLGDADATICILPDGVLPEAA